MKMESKLQFWIPALVVVLMSACKKDNPEPKLTPVETVSLSLEDLKKRSTGTISEANKIFKIKGIVISDKDTKNIDAKTIVLQEGNDKQGIVVNFAVNHNFSLGDELEIGVSNQKLEQVNGEIVLNAVPVDSASKKSTGTITPRTTTIADIKTNKALWNGTLVSIAANELTSTNGKYNGNLTIKDASGTITSLVSTGATFENTDLLASVSKIVGIVRVNGANAQLLLRNQTDVTAGDISKVIIENFTAWTDPTTGTASMAPLTTNVVNWWTNPTGAVYIGKTNAPSDASFTATNKKYPYLYFSYDPYAANLAFDPIADFKGLKKVKITFAGSKALGTGQLNSGHSALDEVLDIQAFNAATDVVKVELWAYTGGSSTSYKIAKSEGFKEVGKFFTAEFTIPTTAAEFVAMAGLTGDGGNNTANSWLNKPGLNIINISTRQAGVSGGVYKQQAPILIDKIEFFF